MSKLTIVQKLTKTMILDLVIIVLRVIWDFQVIVHVISGTYTDPRLSKHRQFSFAIVHMWVIPREHNNNKNLMHKILGYELSWGVQTVI